jgi:hypothetical protein
MTQKIKQPKIRYGRKDDSSLHEFYWQVRREREAKGLPPPENDSFDPHKIIAEWHREQGLTPPWARRHRKKPLSKKNQRHIREAAILIAPAPEHGYLAYCPAVNGKGLYGETMAEAENKMAAYLKNLGKLIAQGKPLPKTGARVKKVKIVVPSLK